MDQLIESSIFPEVQFTYATFLQRLGAKALDVIALIILDIVVGAVLQIFHIDNFSGYWGYVQIVILTVGYNVLQESGAAQGTIGKRALGLKVTNLNGRRITFQQAILRSLGKYISLLIVFVGFLMVLWDNRKQALHDKMAGTLVLE